MGEIFCLFSCLFFVVESNRSSIAERPASRIINLRFNVHIITIKSRIYDGRRIHLLYMYAKGGH